MFKKMLTFASCLFLASCFNPLFFATFEIEEAELRYDTMYRIVAVQYNAKEGSYVKVRRVYMNASAPDESGKAFTSRNAFGPVGSCFMKVQLSNGYPRYYRVACEN